MVSVVEFLVEISEKHDNYFSECESETIKFIFLFLFRVTNILKDRL